MAVDLSKLVSKRKIELAGLANKRIAIDGYNVLYQFLSIIRQQDGTPLMDEHGNVTSHLSGLFYRTIELISVGIRPMYVFDGIPSMLKQKTIHARMKRREDAREAWEAARKEGDIKKARQFAQGSTRVDKGIVESAKRLLDCMGIYYISAPSEGEAQASFLCRNGLVDVVGSQDYDTLLLGAPLVARNITISGKRKLPGKSIYVNVEPELISLGDTLASMQISREQLIWIGLMLGTDFNDGIKGIGPKTALKIAKSSGSVEEVERYIKERYKTEFELDVHEVIALFENPEVREVEASEIDVGMGKKPDRKSIIDFMCAEHGFSAERVGRYADKLISLRGSARQQGIGEWF